MNTFANPINLSIINRSGKSVCIQDRFGVKCSYDERSYIEVSPDNFYFAKGMIKISFSHGPYLIGMVKDNVKEASILFERDGTMRLGYNDFEDKSFIYSNNNDYLCYVFRENKLNLENS